MNDGRTDFETELAVVANISNFVNIGLESVKYANANVGRVGPHLYLTLEYS